MFNEFKKYVQNYDLNNKPINDKYEHSIRVSKLCEKIAANLNFNKHDTILATKIGLLHDISRFYEWTNYHSFHNLKFDHGTYGKKILLRNNYYHVYDILEEDKDDLLNAIYYHNKYKLPFKLKNNKYCLLIRDADKIDILKIIGCNIKHDILPGEKISQAVKEDFFKHHLIKNKDLKTEGDKILSILALVYDLNYNYSINYILNHGYLKQIQNQLGNKEMYENYFNEIEIYLEKRINNVRDKI